MPPKRKITLTLGSSKKKQKSSSLENTSIPIDNNDNNDSKIDFNNKEIPPYYNSLIDFFTYVINHIMNLKDPETNEVISGPFLKLPSKKLYSDYYQLIENPISINEIRQSTIVKRRSKELIDSMPEISLEDFKNMWFQLSKNASTYNDPDSLIVKDANSIKNFAINEINNYENYLEFKKSQDLLKTNNNNDINKKSKSKLKSKSKSKLKSKLKNDNNNNNNDNEDINNSNNVSNENLVIKDENLEINDNKLNDDNNDNNNSNDNNNNDNSNINEKNNLETETNNLDDLNDDYSTEISKILRHLLTFKVSHHKNSIPLSKILLDLPNKNDPKTEDYYEIVTKPMCFNMINQNLKDNKYSNGKIGYQKFIDDVNLIFDNTLDVYGDGPYYKSATGLSKAFNKRLEKFQSQILEKKKDSILDKKNINLIGNDNISINNPNFNIDVNNDNNLIINVDNSINEESNKINNNQIENNYEIDLLKSNIDIPTIIRKHDIEKAKKIEEIDDITAFIKKFTICSITNLNNLANNWKSLVHNPIIINNHTNNNNNNNNNSNSSNNNNNTNNKNNNQSKNSNNNNNTVNQQQIVFENIIVEPAGNTTVGGSTYSLQLPGSAIIGHEIACLIHLQNKIIEEKYISELRVNGEIINGVPISISYDENSDENGMFCSNRYGLRLGYGLNYFEYTLKVPFPLKEKTSDKIIETSNIVENKTSNNADITDTVNKTDADDAGDAGDLTDSADSTEDTEKDDKMDDDVKKEDNSVNKISLENEKKERQERGKSQEFVESVKLWLNITR